MSHAPASPWARAPLLLLLACEAPFIEPELPPPMPEELVPLVPGALGWEAPPGSGEAFIVNNVAIASRDRGFDVDGRCDADGCIDNRLWRLGELANDQIRQGLLGGENLLLIELAGLDGPYRGDDGAVAVKTYGAGDADDPYFPANNFKVPPGHTQCCEFAIRSSSLEGAPPQALSRIGTQIRRGILSTVVPGSFPFVFVFDSQTSTASLMRLERSWMSARVPAELDGIKDGLIGGVLTVRDLADRENPYCKTVSPRCPSVSLLPSTLLDLIVTSVGSPDVDMDGDGLECLVDRDGNGQIDTCCDGAAEGSCGVDRCAGALVPPIDPSKPQSCARDARMADGYSMSLTFTAVHARVVGVQ